jgi:hypothetical protein
MTNQEAMIRAERAVQLMNDTLLKESLDLIEREIIEQWDACPVRDVEGRELLWRYYKTARKFRLILEGVAQNGKVAAFREKQSATDKLVNFVRK